LPERLEQAAALLQQLQQEQVAQLHQVMAQLLEQQ
jgi:hypothetical protein